MSVPIDQPIRLTFNTYSDPAQTIPADPTTVSVDILDPTGVTTTYTWAGAQVVHDSTGFFHLDYTPVAAGHYSFHWKATGAVATSLDGSFDVDAEYTHAAVSTDDFATYLNNPAVTTDPRSRFILDKAQQLCETVVNPLPVGADIVILDVAERAYANPTSTRDSSLALYSEGEGPFAAGSNGLTSGGLWLTENNKQTLRLLAGRGGAFTVDTLPAGYTLSVPVWDTAATFDTVGWDTPP